jgi:hypothetical protein
MNNFAFTFVVSHSLFYGTLLLLYWLTVDKLRDASNAQKILGVVAIESIAATLGITSGILLLEK